MTTKITRARIIEINTAAWRYWRWHAGQNGAWTSDYVAQRGLRGTRVGLAPAGWDRMVRTLRKRGIRDDELLAAGLTVRTGRGRLGDRFRDRIVLPYRDTEGEIVGFTARINPATEVREATTGRDPSPKYLNTSATAAFDKSASLYGLDDEAARRLRAGARLVIVEGPFDREAARRLGSDYVPVATCGTAITAGHLQAVRDIEPTALMSAIVALDPDSAGQRGTVRLWELLTREEASVVSAARLAADPADLLQTGRLADLGESLVTAPPLAHAVVDARIEGHPTETVEGRVAVTRQIMTELTDRLDHSDLARAGTHLADRLGGRRHDHELVVTCTLDAVAGRVDHDAEPDRPPPGPASHTAAASIAPELMAVRGRADAARADAAIARPAVHTPAITRQAPPQAFVSHTPVAAVER